MARDGTSPKKVAVIGSGISGLSAAWLLSNRHQVTVYEQDRRIGGHSNTVTVPGESAPVAVDTGFIVYNEATYPNLIALFRHLGVATQPTNMSFAVSLADGLEYSGNNLAGLFAQKRNLLRPRFWSMLNDLRRFYRDASKDAWRIDDAITMRDYLVAGRFSPAFRDDHLLPMAAAIWSAPADKILDYPAASFLRFHDNHGLLRFRDRPVWRTVVGGSQAYVKELSKPFAERIRIGTSAVSIDRGLGSVAVRDSGGHTSTYDEVVIATHADQALGLLQNPSTDERSLLGAFRYSANAAVLHSDRSLMPRRRATWSSWNYLEEQGRRGCKPPVVSYWMNLLQQLPGEQNYFVTLNPEREPCDVWHSETYEHPLFDAQAMAAQRRLFSLQGRNRTWYCGSYFGAGFHEDGLQSGLAVAEALGAVRRPWSVPNESGRIFLGGIGEHGRELAA
jgi:predicted NAD/FAD-binding protein